MAATFDTLKYAEALKAGGVPDAQAKAQAAALADALKDGTGELVTRHDLKTELLALENRMGERMAEMRGDIKTLRWMVGTVALGILLLLVRAFWPTVGP